MAKRVPVAIVGAASLLGRELVELIHGQKLPVATHLFSGEPESQGGNIAVEDGEPVFYESLSAESLAGVKWILLAGSAESSERAWKFAPRGARLIDVSGALDQKREAVFRSPYGEGAGAPLPPDSRLLIAEHPAAGAIALLLSRLAKSAAAMRRSVVTVFEPASERGQAGVSELQKQTTALLSFQKLPTAVFDAQAAYNLLSAYGEDAPLPLQAVEDRIARHLDSLRGQDAPPVSLRLIQAPVFHGYSFSVWVEFESARPAPEALRAALQDPLIDFRPDDTTQPTNTGAAQMDGLLVGDPKPDRTNPNACWLWMTCDNVRLAADNALRILKEGLE